MSDRDRLMVTARNLLSRAAELLDELAQDAAAAHVHRAVAALDDVDAGVYDAAPDDALPLMRAALATLDAAGKGGGRTACSLQAAINFEIGVGPMTRGDDLPDGLDDRLSRSV